VLLFGLSLAVFSNEDQQQKKERRRRSKGPLFASQLIITEKLKQLINGI